MSKEKDLLYLCKRILILIYICAYIFGYSLSAVAGSTQYGVGAGLHYFSGKEGLSVAPDTGTVLKFAAGEGRGVHLRWWTSLSVLLGSGDAKFTSSGNASAIDYSLKGGEFQVGLKMVPLASQIKIPIQPYFGINLVIQTNSFTFDEAATVDATFPYSDSQMFYGYNISVGTDIIFTKKWGMFLEFAQGTVSGTLGGSTFASGGNTILLGISWY